MPWNLHICVGLSCHDHSCRVCCIQRHYTILPMQFFTKYEIESCNWTWNIMPYKQYLVSFSIVNLQSSQVVLMEKLFPWEALLVADVTTIWLECSTLKIAKFRALGSVLASSESSPLWKLSCWPIRKKFAQQRLRSLLHRLRRSLLKNGWSFAENSGKPT